VCDRVRPARGRAPDHPRARRPARLFGVPPRSWSRPALRWCRSVAAVHVPDDQPAWHAEHFGLDALQAEENAEATLFLEATLFRRYSAKLRFELGFWDRFAEDGGTPVGYSEQLTAAIGMRYPPQNFLSDMDAGFYSADYLRAWVRAAQLKAWLRREIGDEWWRSQRTGELLRELFRQGTQPSSEDVAARLGFDPLDTAPLVAELRH
jgi:hypothetical protein